MTTCGDPDQGLERQPVPSHVRQHGQHGLKIALAQILCSRLASNRASVEILRRISPIEEQGIDLAQPYAIYEGATIT